MSVLIVNNIIYGLFSGLASPLEMLIALVVVMVELGRLWWIWIERGWIGAVLVDLDWV